MTWSNIIHKCDHRAGTKVVLLKRIRFPNKHREPALMHLLQVGYRSVGLVMRGVVHFSFGMRLQLLLDRLNDTRLHLLHV